MEESTPSKTSGRGPSSRRTKKLPKLTLGNVEKPRATFPRAEEGLGPVAPLHRGSDKPDVTKLLKSSSPIASGSFGDVYLMVDLQGADMSAMSQPLADLKRLYHIYALKVMRVSMDERQRSDFKKELRALTASQCEHVVRCFDYFIRGDTVSILMEYMDLSLRDVLDSIKAVPEASVASIARQALKGLCFIHGNHVVHRDIKPANLLLNRHGHVKLADFGVSVVQSSSMSRADSYVGTSKYMAPERIDARTGDKHGLKSDIWSLGLSLLECAIGRFPYGERLALLEHVAVIANSPAPQVPEEGFSEEFRDFIAHCLQKRKEDRWSAVQLMEHRFIKDHEDDPPEVANVFQVYERHRTLNIS